MNKLLLSKKIIKWINLFLLLLFLGSFLIVFAPTGGPQIAGLVAGQIFLIFISINIPFLIIYKILQKRLKL